MKQWIVWLIACLCVCTMASAALAMSEDEAAALALEVSNPGYENAQKLVSSQALVYQPVEGWSYAHHAHIASFNGKLYATFSLGRENEDDCGQRIMISSSSDEGKTWTEPVPLMDSMMGEDSERVLINGGLYVHDGQMNAYFSGYEYYKSSLRGPNLRPAEDAYRYNYFMYIMTTADGIHWSEPMVQSVPALPSYGPIPLESGRLILCSGSTFLLTDDPAGMKNIRTKKVYTDWALQNGAKMITEGSFFQLDNGLVYMMYRSNTDRLWCAIGRKNGEFWSGPYPTNFSDCGTKMRFGRLSNGCYFYIGSPVPGSNRLPLVLSLSDDGLCYDRHYILRDEPYKQQFSGMYKGGVYAYPDAVEAEGKLYIVYSKHKEAIEVTTISISDLQ